jgi:hypothetical protein
MNKKAIILLASVLLMGCLATSCDTPFGVPIFPDQPTVSFKNIRPFPLDSPLRDSLIVTITFRDGDGNLGLTARDLLPPFNPDTLINGQRQANPYFFNYHINVLKKLNGSFEQVEFPTQGFTFNGRFPVLKPDGEKGPIEGDLEYSVRIEPPQSLINPRYIRVGDTLKFEIFIYDRALNKSNTIQTSEIIVLRR